MAIVAVFAGGMSSVAGSAAVKARTDAENAEHTSEALSGFVDMIVHEMRSPLTVISGFAELLAETPSGEDPEKRNIALTAIRAKAMELQETVEQLLFASRLDAGVDPTESDHGRQTVAVGAVVRDMVEKARPRAELVGGEVVCTSSDGAGQVDRALVSHILDNLINNAITYGGNPPQVKVAYEANGSHVLFRISDNGPGVPERFRDRIFERFFRIEEGSAAPGSGLGLWVSRELATRAGGDLTLAQPGNGEGSTFVLRIPKAEAVES
jgi:signal transduction histidine kinase